jgi:hypothetical protein
LGFKKEKKCFEVPNEVKHFRVRVSRQAVFAWRKHGLLLLGAVSAQFFN